MMYELLLPQSHMPFSNVSSSIAAAAAVTAVSHGAEDMNTSTIYTNPLFDTFHQMPHGDFKPTFYNPFEIKHRRRTSRAQFKVLERTFMENPKPSAAVRRILAQKLNMAPRGVQVWFQNRRAKAKLQKQQDEKQHLEGSLQGDPGSPTSSGMGYSSPSGSSQGSVSSSKEIKSPQNDDMYSAFSTKIQQSFGKSLNANCLHPFSQTNGNGLEEGNQSFSPKFRSDNDSWFSYPNNNEYQVQHFSSLLNGTSTPLEQSISGPMRGNMRSRQAAGYGMPYNAGLLRRKSCPGDLINNMYTSIANANREKLQAIPEVFVPNTNYMSGNMNSFMNTMQMRVSRRMSEPCINYSVPTTMANQSFSPLLCRAYSIDSSSNQEGNTNSFHSSHQPSPQFSLQAQLNEFEIDDGSNSIPADTNLMNEQQHPLDANSVDSINLQINSFDLVNTPVSMGMSI